MNEQNTPGGEVTKVPTKEERDRDRKWLTVNYSMGAAIRDAMEKYIAALDHVEAERDALDAALRLNTGLTQDTLIRERDAAVKFKTFVHTYLDQHGVPHGDPENQHQKEGCRIGARLDLMFAERDELVIDKTNLASANELLREENARLENILNTMERAVAPTIIAASSNAERLRKAEGLLRRAHRNLENFDEYATSELGIQIKDFLSPAPAQTPRDERRGPRPPNPPKPTKGEFA